MDPSPSYMRQIDVTNSKMTMQRYYSFPTASVISETVVHSKSNKLRVAITIYCLMA